MAHRNLYEVVGKDPSASSEEIIATIKATIESSETPNAALSEELQRALAIFSEPRRRAAYDAFVNDASHGEVDEAISRDIAETEPEDIEVPEDGDSADADADADPDAVAGSAVGSAVAVSQQDGADASDSDADSDADDAQESRSSVPWKAIVITAAVTALVCLAAFALATSLLKPATGSYSQPSEHVAEDFLNIDSAESGEQFLNEHATPASKATMEQGLGLDSDDFTSVREVLNLQNAEVIDSINGYDVIATSANGNGRPLKDEFEDAGVDDVAFVRVGDPDTQVSALIMMVYIQDGQAKIGAISQAAQQVSTDQIKYELSEEAAQDLNDAQQQQGGQQGQQGGAPQGGQHDGAQQGGAQQ